MNILVNEGNRRLKNHSPHLKWLEKKKDLDKLLIQVEECGHTEEFRGLVAVRTVSRYWKSLRNPQEGSRRMYRSRQEQQEQVRAAGGKAIQSNWFKKLGATNVLRDSLPPKTVTWPRLCRLLWSTNGACYQGGGGAWPLREEQPGQT